MSVASAAEKFLDDLIKLIPRLRNELAHGSSMLMPYGHGTLGFCCDIVNQLFDGVDKTSKTKEDAKTTPSSPGQS